MKQTFLLFLIQLLLTTQSAFAQGWHEIEIVERSPIDLSFLLDAPTGKHGYLGVNDGKFVFEDGTPFRAWGTTLSGQACFPTHEQAPKVAEQLASYGFNLVRLKDWDAHWVRPPLFNDNANSPSAFTPEMVDRLDYFIFQLANRGIYIYLEGLSSLASRDYPERLSFPNGLVHFMAEMEADYSGKIVELWLHRNPYLDQPYRDDPSIVMMNLFHDSTLTTAMVRTIPFQDELILQWDEWLLQSGREARDFQATEPSVLEHEFLAYLLDQSYVNTKFHLRRLGIKCAISGNNAIFEGKDLAAILGMDFVTTFGIWNPVVNSRFYYNFPMLGINPLEGHQLLRHFAFAKLEDKPLVVSEWGEPWPNTFRAEMPLWVAAMACWQDWDGLIGMPFRSQYDEPEKLNFLELYNDPCQAGLLPAAAVMFHQRHVAPSDTPISMNLSESDLFASEQWTSASVRPNRFLEQTRFGIKIQSQVSSSNILAPTMPTDIELFQQKYSQHSPVVHDWENGLVTINAEKTQAVIGNLQAVTGQSMASVEVIAGVSFGVVSVTALDDQPIAQSGRLFITLVSDAQNTAFVSSNSQEENEIVRHGQLPIRLQETPVRIFLKSESLDWVISPIGFDGKRHPPVPYQVMDGQITFEIGREGVMYYLLEKKN